MKREKDLLKLARRQQARATRDELSHLQDENKRLRLQAGRDRATIDRQKQMLIARDDQRKWSEIINHKHRLNQASAIILGHMMASPFALMNAGEDQLADKAYNLAYAIEQRLENRGVDNQASSD